MLYYLKQQKNLNDNIHLGYSQVVKASVFDIDTQRFEPFYPKL
jgi:hypothetical protein